MQQISLPKRLIPVLSVKVNIGFEICQHMERMHYSLKDFSHFVLGFVKTVYHSYRSESTGSDIAALNVGERLPFQNASGWKLR